MRRQFDQSSPCQGGLSQITREVLVREVSVQLSDRSLAERNRIALRFLMLKPYLLSHFLSQSLSLSLYYLIQACYYSVCVRFSWSRWVALGNPQLSPTICRDENGVTLSYGSGAHIAWACWLLASHTFCISTPPRIAPASRKKKQTVRQKREVSR